MVWWRRRDEERSLAASARTTEGSMPPLLLSSTSSGAMVTPGDALAIADAYACVRALADAAASLPLIPYRRTAYGRRRVDDGRLPDLLRAPAPATTHANLVGQAIAQLNLHGNAYLGKFRGASGN